MKKYIAECLGTFTLTLAVGFSLAGKFPVPTPVIAALAVAFFVYAIGHLSGCHINPSITIGAWSVRKISTRDAAAYVVAQFIGAGIAMFIIQNAVAPAGIIAGDNVSIFLGELLGTFFLAFGIAAAVHDKLPLGTTGIVIGGALLLGVSLASPFSNGLLNPALAFGLGSLSFSYVLGPIVGSILGMQGLAWLIKEKKV